MCKETPKVQKEINNEQPVIKALLKHGTLASFDIRDHVFQTVAKDVSLKEESNKRFCFMSDVGIYHTTDNVLIRTAIGKKWANKDGLYGYDYDYDAALMSSIIMRNIILQDGTIEHAHGYEYVISCEEGGKHNEYRGDTMNSWATTLNEYIKCLGGGKKSWTDFLSVSADYGKTFPPYITHFLNVVYTIGNFIPVLKTPTNFNTKRYNRCCDYWDLTLLAIYNYYHQLQNDDKWETLLEKSKDWLGEQTATNWDAFVEKNLLQDFVTPNPEKGYGLPKELWYGHFKDEPLPSKEDEFISFFTNASAWIIARGTRMMIALDKQMTEKENSKENI